MKLHALVLVLLPALALSLLSNSVLSQPVIKSLPGFPGELPFYLETGYIGVGEMEDVQLFYYFIESARSPKDDPLLLWLTGGPGCSALSAILYEIGPFTFNYQNSTRGRPTLELNPYAWTKVANIIFLDQPVGTGFSYSRTSQGYNLNDYISAEDTYEFLRKWIKLHYKFRSNPLYVSGDSYSGIIVPMVALKIADGNKAGHQPRLNLQGYTLGNPLTDKIHDLNSRVPFSYQMALISKPLYESTKTNCKGHYYDFDPDNANCTNDLVLVVKCVEKLDIAQILEPLCQLHSPVNSTVRLRRWWEWDPTVIDQDHRIQSLLLTSTPEAPRRIWCRSYNYLYSYIWANNEEVKDALHVRKGTIEEWSRCNESLSYTYTVTNVIKYHIELIKRGYRILVYSGDHDMVVPYVGTFAWIESLNLTVSIDWEPWFVDGQVAGYVMVFYDKESSLTYVSVKGAGHTAPEYKPKQCLAMVDRWFAYFPL